MGSDPRTSESRDSTSNLPAGTRFEFPSEEPARDARASSSSGKDSLKRTWFDFRAPLLSSLLLSAMGLGILGILAPYLKTGEQIESLFILVLFGYAFVFMLYTWLRGHDETKVGVSLAARMVRRSIPYSSARVGGGLFFCVTILWVASGTSRLPQISTDFHRTHELLNEQLSNLNRQETEVSASALSDKANRMMDGKAVWTRWILGIDTTELSQTGQTLRVLLPLERRLDAQRTSETTTLVAITEKTWATADLLEHLNRLGSSSSPLTDLKLFALALSAQLKIWIISLFLIAWLALRIHDRERILRQWLFREQGRLPWNELHQVNVRRAPRWMRILTLNPNLGFATQGDRKVPVFTDREVQDGYLIEWFQSGTTTQPPKNAVIEALYLLVSSRKQGLFVPQDLLRGEPTKP